MTEEMVTDQIQISFTFILPLFPQLLDFYKNAERVDSKKVSALRYVLTGLNLYKQSFARPISDRYDIVLLGGALGSLFSLLQAIAAPGIGKLSDRYGRRRALLWSLAGNIASVSLWLAATDFQTFLASRIVGGLSEGNVQLANAIAADVSDPRRRGATMALVGVCFSIAFTFGPMLGAALANITLVQSNPFATAAGFSLFLIVAETFIVYKFLPETGPQHHSGFAINKDTRAIGKDRREDKIISNTGDQSGQASHSVTQLQRTNSHALLNLTHFVFILFFSGMEFSLPFMTYDLFSYSAAQTGKLLGMMGLIASILQGTLTRRLQPLRVVQIGIFACALSLFGLARVSSEAELYMAAALLAVTTGTTVTGLNSLSSLEAAQNERGGKLGSHRAWGQLGRACGPLMFCSLYWWAGREMAYNVGGLGMLGVCTIAFGVLQAPQLKPG